MIFLILTDKLGKKFILNIGQVETFTPLRATMEGHTSVMMISGRDITVEESVEEIKKMLDTVLQAFPGVEHGM